MSNVRIERVYKTFLGLGGVFVVCEYRYPIVDNEGNEFLWLMEEEIVDQVTPNGPMEIMVKEMKSEIQNT